MVWISLISKIVGELLWLQFLISSLKLFVSLRYLWYMYDNIKSTIKTELKMTILLEITLCIALLRYAFSSQLRMFVYFLDWPKTHKTPSHGGLLGGWYLNEIILKLYSLVRAKENNFSDMLQIDKSIIYYKIVCTQHTF